MCQSEVAVLPSGSVVAAPATFPRPVSKTKSHPKIPFAFVFLFPFPFTLMVGSIFAKIRPSTSTTCSALLGLSRRNSLEPSLVAA
uniref:Uncharacterized protein n=1 Tax=Physcomitrium patens TaxID=3218 RepID=A0A2K1JQ48_PHYPA|nr:hypothetical protein PHYPA_016047 [Physcomitrium patens]